MAFAASGYVGAATVGAGLLGSALAPSTSGNSAARDTALAQQSANLGKAAGVGDTLNTIGSNQQADYQANFAPLSKSIGTMAQNAGSVAQQNQNAGLATAGVDQAFANTEGANSRNLSRTGAAPSSGAAMALNNSTAIAKAAAEAGAGTSAKINTYNLGLTQQENALALGNTMNGISTLSNAGNTFNGVASGLGSAAYGQQSAINAGNTISNQMASGLGSVAGGALNAYYKNNPATPTPATPTGGKP